MGIIILEIKFHLINMGKDDKFILYCRKIINNPLLRRKQVQVEIIHPDQGGVSKADIKEKLAGMFKQRQAAQPECISVFGLRTKYDQKKMLRRDGLAAKGKVTRKMGKEIKGRTKK